MIPLVREAQGGAPRALDALLARLRPSFVAYFAVALGGDEAEDAAQLALLSIVRALPRIDAERALGYVLAVAGHRLGKARRRRACAERRSAGPAGRGGRRSSRPPGLTHLYRGLHVEPAGSCQSLASDDFDGSDEKCSASRAGAEH